MDENKSHGEIQSKTVLLQDNDGVNDMLSSLNVGREKMEKEKKRKKRNKIIVIVAGAVITVGLVMLAVYMVL